MTSSVALPQEAKTERQASALSNWLALALYCINAVLILMLPVFPSQDGPVHLYYVDIIRDLLTNSGQYDRHFAIKQLVTPYAFQYYTLMALETVFTAETSEKLLVCLYLAAFGLAFKYLVDSVTGGRSPWVLASVPFAMHSLVFMGFVNYCFAVALTMFLCGYWVRHANHLDRKKTASVVLIFLLLMFVHPVPLAIFLGFAGLYVLADMLTERLNQPQATIAGLIQARSRQIALLAGLTFAALLWVSMFRADPAVIKTKLPPEPSWTRKLTEQIKMWPIVPYATPSYRIGPFLLALAAIGAILVALPAGIRRFSPAAIACFFTSTACYLLYVAAPQALNGSSFFSNRFPIVWVVFLFATAAAVTRLNGRWQYAIPLLAVPISLWTLNQQWRVTSAIVENLQPVLQAKPMSPHSIGLVAGDGVPDGFRIFDPYVWSGAHYFRRSRAVLGNMPWLNLPIIMLRPVRTADWDYLDPFPMSEYLADERLKQLPIPDLAFFVRPGEASKLTAKVVRRWGFKAAGYENKKFELYTTSELLPTVARTPSASTQSTP